MPFTLGMRTKAGFITIRWTYIEKIIITGHESDDSLYFYSSWIELGYDEDEQEDILAKKV